MAKMVGFHERGGEIERDVVAAIGPERAASPRWQALLCALRRGDGPAPPRLPAPRRDGDLDPAAGRRLPGRAGGDGGAPDRPVGQGLLRATPASSRSTCSGWGCSPRSSAASRKSAGRGASGSTSRGSRSTTPRPSNRSAPPRPPASSRSRAAPRCRCCRAPCPENLDDLTVQVALVRPGPIQGGAVHPYIERRKRLREDPELRDPLRAPAAGAGAGGHARHDRLPGAGDRGGDGAGRLHLRRGGGAAAGDEPQALRGGDAQATTTRFVAGAAGKGVSARGRRSGSGSRSRASPASASRRRTRPPSACSPTSRPGCGSTTRPSSSARC